MRLVRRATCAWPERFGAEAAEDTEAGGRLHDIEHELRRLVRTGLPGAFVYIEDADGSSQFLTAGWADLEGKTRMTPESHYRVGSTTKTFTAVVALQLVSEGRLRLDDTLGELLPHSGVPAADRMTIEHLLRMRSGLFDFEDDLSLLGNLDAHRVPVSLERAVELGIRQPLLFEPGARFSYCNTNFCLLEIVIERVSGQGLSEAMRQRIIDPLGLSATHYPPEAQLALPEPFIRGYERTRDGWEECSEVFFGRGDGALISTAVDLATFFRALLVEGRLLNAEMLGRMMAILPDDPPAAEAYGLGLIADPLGCGVVWGHGGGGFGYENLPYLRLETGRFAVFMLNGSYGYRASPVRPRGGRPRFSPRFRTSVYC
jgi:D-alanyl-D-alanine carboxypeptidase